VATAGYLCGQNGVAWLGGSGDSVAGSNLWARDPLGSRRGLLAAAWLCNLWLCRENVASLKCWLKAFCANSGCVASGWLWLSAAVFWLAQNLAGVTILAVAINVRLSCNAMCTAGCQLSRGCNNQLSLCIISSVAQAGSHSLWPAGYLSWLLSALVCVCSLHHGCACGLGCLQINVRGLSKYVALAGGSAVAAQLAAGWLAG